MLRNYRKVMIFSQIMRFYVNNEINIYMSVDGGIQLIYIAACWVSTVINS